MATPIEAAGISLAAVSLSFQIFAGCVQGFQLLSSAHHLGQDAELLVCMLKLEEYKLILWSKKSGLIDDKLDPRLNTQIIDATLAELRMLFQDTEKLKKRYKLELANKEAEQQSSTSASSFEALRFLDNDPIIKEQEKILARAKLEQKGSVFSNRLWWAAVDRKGLENLIARVGLLVQKLFDILGIVDEEDIQRQFNLIQLSLVSMAGKLEHIRLVQDMIAGAVTTDDTLTTIVALKALSIDLDRADPSPNPRQPPTIQKQLLQQVEDLHSGHDRATAIYEGMPVFIERKRYSESDVQGPNAIFISNRVKNLAILLGAPNPPSFRTLHCIGTTHDSLKLEYQFVFDRSLRSTAHVAPRSLLSLLRSSFIPSQTDRFRLATELATTLLHLHASGWLHKGLRSDNILFFPPTSDAPRALDEPYIMGYEFARHDKPGELSQKPSQNPAYDVYRHPRAQGPVSSNFTKGFDIYSLGIMLLEIAYWRAFGDIIEKMGVKAKDVSPESMQQIRQRILDEQGRDQIPQNIRFKMGDIYAKVVLCCLGTLFEDGGLITPKDFITTYFDMVIWRLRRCTV